MRKALDFFYDICGVWAALFLIAIGGLILWQVGARWIGASSQGLSEYAGYCMAASSFLALAHTLRHGGHIRVLLFLQRLHGRPRRIAELWCLGAGGFFAGYLAWFSIRMVRVSYELGDVSEGFDATELWIPQSAMAFGATVLCLAIVDRFITVSLGGDVVQQNVDSLLKAE